MAGIDLLNKIPAHSPQARAFVKTTLAVALPTIGCALWIMLMIWCDALVNAQGMISVMGSIFGLPALVAVAYGVWSLYRYFLQQEQRKDRGY